MLTAVPTSKDVLAYERTALRCMVECGIGQVDGDDPSEVAYANAIATGITGVCAMKGGASPIPNWNPWGVTWSRRVASSAMTPRCRPGSTAISRHASLYGIEIQE